MAHSALTPVFVGLRTGLHVLFVALAGLVIGRALFTPSSSSVFIVVWTVLLLVTYGVGGALARTATPARRRTLGLVWLAVVTAEWIVLLGLSTSAAYLVFPLFFLYLHLLGRGAGSAAVIGVTVIAIVALGLDGGWSVGGVVGPLVGAGVALLIGLGYQALAREAAEREELVRELLATRDQLAATEHESGVLAERSRLAREIHDTVAQGLASIQMLLHAAERADPERPGVEHIRLARETAASNLADTRRFIRELTPPDLDDEGLGGALRRLAETQWRSQGVEVDVRVDDSPPLPMHLQTALLRIAQGAMANVIQHAQARTAVITLERGDVGAVRFSVADDGRGFEASGDLAGGTDEGPLGNSFGAVPGALPGALSGALPPGRSDSFGLQATRERVDQLGGTLTVDSSPGRGTRLTVSLLEGEAP